MKIPKAIRWALIIVGALLVALGIFVFAANLHVKLSVKNQMFADAEEYVENADDGYPADCILVLGAGVRDGEPSAMLEDRLLAAIKLYENGVAPKILMSGDHEHDNYDEVNVMKSFAIERGVPSEDIFMDHAGLSTYESVYRAKEIFGAQNMVIVTQEYHLYRALYIAKKMGVGSLGVCSDPREYSGEAKREIREIAARTKDMLWCAFFPEPTYLGDLIPLFQTGDITNDTYFSSKEK